MLSLGLTRNRVRNRALGLVFGQLMDPKARASASGKLKHAMQGEFVAKKYYELILDDYMHRARPGWP
jgi:hypothetical protein